MVHYYSYIGGAPDRKRIEENANVCFLRQTIRRALVVICFVKTIACITFYLLPSLPIMHNTLREVDHGLIGLSLLLLLLLLSEH